MRIAQGARWLLAVVAVVCVRGAAEAAAPGVLRTQHLVAAAARGPGRKNGALQLRLHVADADVAAAARAGTLRVRVRDVAAFDVDVPLARCRRVGRGAACRSRHGAVRARLTPANVLGRHGWDVRVKVARLGAAVTGTASPTPPFRVTLAGAWRDAPLNVVRSCRARGRVVRCGPSRPPNVVVVLTDDQRWDTLHAMPEVQARLMARGTTFTNAFVTTPVCCPSRASILSGLYAHNHGTHTIGPPDGGAPGFVGPDGSTLATWLRDAGYRTGLFGKYMNGYPALGPPRRPTWYVPPGWTDWAAMLRPQYFDYELVTVHGLLEAHGAAPADYSTDVTAAKALAFVDAAIASGEPFFVFFAPFAPHVSERFVATPAPRHAGRFADLPPWRPPSFNEPDVSDKPAWIRETPPLSGAVQVLVQTNRRRGYESLLAVDEAVAALLDRAEVAGLGDETVVLYTSDNGFAHGEHRQRAKLCPYDECLRVPFVLRAPDVAAPGTTDDRLVENVDVAATVAALVGVAPPDPIDGRSLVPALLGDEAPWRDDVLVEQWQVFENTPAYFAVRSARWKYVEQRTTGEAELYDLDADPFELESRADDPLLADLRAALRARAVVRSTAPPGAALP
jgi:N-acetylglucosamine-6-sulfatase